MTPSASYTPASRPVCVAPSTCIRYQNVVAHDENGRFLRSTSVHTYSALDELVQLTADESTHTALAHPKASFDALRTDTAAQAFLRKSTSLRQPLYYVTGIQTLKNPSFKRLCDIIKVNDIPSQIKRVDSAMHLEMIYEEVKPSTNESIFAVELLKVRCRVGLASDPHSIDDVDFLWTYHSLGDDTQLSIGLGAALNGAELRALAGIESDEVSSNLSWDSEYSDEDEGFGGN
jgi:hypothetical protein